MLYPDGRKALIGDRVRLWGEGFGIFVCSIDDEKYSEEFTREDWRIMECGVVIQKDDGELFHYEKSDEDLELLTRNPETSHDG